MPELDKDSMKEAVKEAIKEWLNEKASEFGWWTLKWLGSAAVAGILWLAVKKEIG